MIGMIFYMEGHVDKAEFSRMVERATGEAVPMELVRHWYGRAVPLKLGSSWNGKGHTFTAKPGQGAKKFTVFDAGAYDEIMKNKQVKSGFTNDFRDKPIQIDIMAK